MAYEPRDGEGSLFKNERREKDTHPNLKGSIRINGQDYWLDAWTNESPKAGKWLKVKATLKEARPIARSDDRELPPPRRHAPVAAPGSIDQDFNDTPWE